MNDSQKEKLLNEKANLLKAMAHPMRLCILDCLMAHHTCNVKSLTERLHQPQSTISQHLSKLKAQGLITGNRHGVEIQYSIIHDDVRSILNQLLKDLHNENPNQR